MLLGVLLWCRNSDVPAMPQTQRGANSHLDTFFSLWTLFSPTGTTRRKTLLFDKHQRKKKHHDTREQDAKQPLATRCSKSRLKSVQIVRSFTSCHGAPVPECNGRNTILLATREIENHIEWSSARHHRDACVNGHHSGTKKKTY